MHKNKITLLAIAAAFLLAACAPQAAAAPAAADVLDAALVMSGAEDAGWTLADLQAMPQTSAEYTNKDGETTTFEGVSIADLLVAVGVMKYDSVTLLAADDYAVNVDFARLDACADCIVIIQEDNSLKSVMPGFEGLFQVRDLIEIQVE
jgi:hypothetical protein